MWLIRIWNVVSGNQEVLSVVKIHTDFKDHIKKRLSTNLINVFMLMTGRRVFWVYTLLKLISPVSSKIFISEM